MTADGDTQNHSGTQDDGDTQDGPGRRDHTTQQPVPETAPDGGLPNKAAEDDPRRWGDEAGGDDHDSWLQEQKPPHWG